MNTKRLVFLAIMLTVSIALNIIERLVLMGFTGLPMVRLGLANVVVLILLYVYSFRDAFAVLLLRILLVGLLAPGATIFSFFLSLAGGLFAIAMMTLFKRLPSFSIIGVSVMGAAGHAVGQILTAVFLFSTEEVVFILPLFMTLSIPTGVFTGIVAKRMIVLLKQTSSTYEY